MLGHYDFVVMKKTRWFTSRKLITAVGVAIASTALFRGKMSDSVWVYAMAVFIAGHHAGDLIKAWRGSGSDVVDNTVLPAPIDRDWKGDKDGRDSQPHTD